MEDIVETTYKAGLDNLLVSRAISAQSLIHKWKGVLTEDELTLHNHSIVCYEWSMDSDCFIPSNILEELFIVTNPAETLYPKNLAPFKAIDLDGVPTGTKLQTVKFTMDNKNLKKENVQYYNTSNSNMEYTSKCEEHLAHKYATLNSERQSSQHCEKDFLALTTSLLKPEVIFSITVFKQQSFARQEHKRGMANMTLHLLDRHTLAALRDAIKCPRDAHMPGDFSRIPGSMQSCQNAAKIFDSSLFFIENKFYVDKSNLKSNDYSRLICEWLAKKCGKKSYPVLEMAHAKLFDLKLRLGMPYLFIHQGNCEHVFQFADMRLLCSSDCQVPTAYPLIVSSNQSKFTICNACQVRAVKWMVTNCSEVSPNDPSHYCDICYKMLHYKYSGEKICDFQAYRFTDNDFVAQF